MKIDIPLEIDDPVWLIEYTQHDGYYITPERFQYSMIGCYLNGLVFSDGSLAKKRVDELNTR